MVLSYSLHAPAAVTAGKITQDKRLDGTQSFLDIVQEIIWE